MLPEPSPMRQSLKNLNLVALLFCLMLAPLLAQTKVNSVLHSGRNALQPGDTLHIIMTGSPGGQATAEIFGLPGTENLTETSPGRYEADVLIPSGLNVVDQSLIVTLVVAGDRALGESTRGVTILPGKTGGGITPVGNPNPAPPPAPRALGATRLTPSNGAVLTSQPRELILEFPVPIDMNTVQFVVNGTDVTRQAVSDSRSANRQTLLWSTQGNNLRGRVEIDVTAQGFAGDPLQQSWKFRVQPRSAPAPAPPTPPVNKPSLQITNIQPGMLLGSNFVVAGNGIPGSNVMATVEFPKRDFLSQLAGVMLKFQGQGTVDSQGRYIINLDAGGVKRGQPMHITLTDSSGSAPIKVSVEKGQANLQQPKVAATKPTTPKAKANPFFSNQHRYGFDIAPGWSRATDPDFDIKVAKGNHSSFGVVVRPANGQTVDDGILELKNLLVNGGATITSEETTNISGHHTKALLIKDKGGEEGFVTCTIANGKFYHVIVESTKMSTDPIVERDLEQMVASFVIR